MAVLLTLLLVLLCPGPAWAGFPRFAAPVPADSCHDGCAFNGLGCYEPDLYHTAWDYIPNGAPVTVLAAADGTVAALFTIDDPGAADHGMGNALVLRHELPSGGVIFSLYGHLAHFERGFELGEVVLRGEPVGLMGGSGFGEPTFWGAHLHFELKTAPVLGDPATGQHEGYTPSPAGNWGYLDPAQFLGQREYNPLVEEAISAPAAPSGPAQAGVGQVVWFRSGGAACTWWHAVEYCFEWGDGQQSGWVAEPAASHAWSELGPFTVKVRARCAENGGIVSEAATAQVEVLGAPVNPDPDPNPAASSDGGGCFIATAAWGGADGPELGLLRRLRDEHLRRWGAGRWLIARYGEFSPPAARYLSAGPWLRPLVRAALRPVCWLAGQWMSHPVLAGWLAAAAGLILGAAGLDGPGALAGREHLPHQHPDRLPGGPLPANDGAPHAQAASLVDVRRGQRRPHQADPRGDGRQGLPRRLARLGRVAPAQWVPVQMFADFIGRFGPSGAWSQARGGRSALPSRPRLGLQPGQGGLGRPGAPG